MERLPVDLRAVIAGWGDLDRSLRVATVRRMREAGLSLGEIAERVPLSKSTISVWCRGVELNDEQRAAIQRRRGSQKGVKRDTQWRRREEVDAIRRMARKEAPRLVEDPIFAAGVALYWAEGSKSSRYLQMANSDPRLLSLFICWVRAHLDAEAEFTLALNLHADNDVAEAERFWQGALPIARPRFTKAFIKPDGSGHRRNHLPHGVCRVTTRKSADHWIRCMEWIEHLAGLGDG